MLTPEMKRLVRLNVEMRLAAIPPDARPVVKGRVVRKVVSLAKAQNA